MRCLLRLSSSETGFQSWLLGQDGDQDTHGSSETYSVRREYEGRKPADAEGMGVLPVYRQQRLPKVDR